MDKRILSALAVAVLGALVLLPTHESAAAGGLSVSLICEPAFDGAFCEALPQGSGFTYGWNTTGNLGVASGSPSSPFRSVFCWGGGPGGTVRVTVTAANGDRGSATKWIGCGGGF